VSGRGLTFDHLVAIALEAAGSSTCRSQRGAAAFTGSELEGRELVAVGFNQQPTGPCDGSERCKATCRREAVHAEQALILSGVDLAGGGSVEVLHVKAIGGVLVVSGGPDCIECAKLLRFAGVVAVWLYHFDGWRRYPIEEFHRLSIAGEYERLRKRRAEARTS
jgi:deoxycytidylate deaminase